MSLSQASPDRAAGTARSWEASAPATEKSDGAPTPAGGMLTMAGATAFLRRNARKIGSLALILFTAGIVILQIVPVRYAATALVLVDPRELHVTADQDVLPGIGQDAAALQSLIEIAKSDGFLRPLIEKLKVADDDDIAGSEQNPSRLLDKFRTRLDISRRGLTYVIAMTFRSRSPQQAAYYANAVAEALVANQTRFRTGAIEDAASFLNSRLKTLNDQVRAADDAVAAFKAEHGIINAGKDSTTRQLRVTELSQQVSAARLLTEEAKNRYAQAQRNLKADVEGTTASRTDLLGILRAQRSQLNDQIAQKRAVLGDRHPDLVISYNQLNELNRNIDSAKSDYETLRDQQKSLEQQLASFEGEMRTDVQASVKLQELQRDADASRNIYEQFLSRFKTTNEQRLLQTSQARIVSAATAPTRPTRPPLALILIALALGAVLISTAIVALLDQAKGPSQPIPATVAAVPAPAAADATADLPVWGRIPNLAVSLGDKLGWRTATARNGEADLRSHLQELLQEITATSKPCGSVVLVTSGQPGVGKSSVARSLNAAAIERGMLSVLIRIAPDSDAVQHVQLASVEGASTRGRVLTTTARSLGLLLGEGRDRQAPAVPGDVRSEFDLIVIDAPAVGPQSDAAAMAAHADFTILVVADGAANAGIVRSAHAALAGFGNTRLGLVVNRMGPRTANPSDLIARDRRPQRSSLLA